MDALCIRAWCPRSSTGKLEGQLKRWQPQFTLFNLHQYEVSVWLWYLVLLNFGQRSHRCTQSCSSQVDYSWNLPPLSNTLETGSLNFCPLAIFFQAPESLFISKGGGNKLKKTHNPTTQEHSSRGRQSPLLAACSRGTRQRRCCWGDCLNSMTNKGLTMHGFQGALFSFLCFYFLFFVLFYFFYFIFLLFFLFNFCVLATPRRTVCFWFLPLRLHGKFSFSFFRDGNVQILSLYTFIYLFFTLLIMLLVIYCRVWGQTKRVTVTRSLQALWVKRGLVWPCKLLISPKFFLQGLFSVCGVCWGLNLFSAWEKFLAVGGGGNVEKFSLVIITVLLNMSYLYKLNSRNVKSFFLNPGLYLPFLWLHI